MSEQWYDFLRQHQAAVGEGRPTEWPESPADANCGIVDLSHYGLICVRGEDTDTFLQGQLTNDIRALTPEHSHLAGICSPKGRMLANFRLFRRDGAVYLQLPRQNLDTVLKKLSMFVLRAKTKLSDASDELMRLGLIGGCAQDLLAERFPNLPENENGVVDSDGLTLIRCPGERMRFEVIGPIADLIDLWQRSLRDATPLNAAVWAREDILAGIPAVLPENVDAFVPQMANMHLVDGVSFKKGCYTGQEVVARMQYLGKLKRRMYRAHVESDTPLRAGDELYSPESGSGQGSGRIVDAQPNPAGGYDLLAVIEVSVAEGNSVFLVENGPKLEILPLPYAFPS